MISYQTSHILPFNLRNYYMKNKLITGTVLYRKFSRSKKRAEDHPPANSTAAFRYPRRRHMRRSCPLHHMHTWHQHHPETCSVEQQQHDVPTNKRGGLPSFSSGMQFVFFQRNSNFFTSYRLDRFYRAFAALITNPLFSHQTSSSLSSSTTSQCYLSKSSFSL